MNWYDPIVHELPCGSECVPSALKKHQVKCFTCSELANARAKALKDLSNKSLNSLAMFGDDISDSSDEETAVVQVSTQVELQPSNQAGVPQVSPQGGRQPPNQDESTPGDESDEETEVSPQVARQLPTPVKRQLPVRKKSKRNRSRVIQSPQATRMSLRNKTTAVVSVLITR